MQVRAIAEATLIRLRQGGRPRPEIMVPLVADVHELAAARSEIERILAATPELAGTPIGTMIETPRAALTAGAVAAAADFFSFGTNDLTQMTWGFSRDDVEGSFLPGYLGRGILVVSPFESIDRDGVGQLVRTAVTARPGQAVPTSPSASAASTAATPPRSGSSTRPASTTCPARRSGSRWRAWRPDAPPSLRRSPRVPTRADFERNRHGH